MAAPSPSTSESPTGRRGGIPPTRALVVGAGETSGLIHLPALARLRDASRLCLVEICDVRHARAAAAAARFGFERESGDALAAVRRPDVQAVYLFGDARMHHDLGLAAVEAGKHLFVEKPVAPSYAEACELAEAAARRGLVAAGGHNRRFYRSLQAIRERGGRAGWRFAEVVFHKPSWGLAPPFGAASWLTANGVHALDALLFVMGGWPESLTAHADGEAYSALMRWPDGAQGTFLCNNTAGERRETYAFHAPGVSCWADEGGLRITSPLRVVTLETPQLGDGFEAEHTAFLDAIEHGVQPPNSLAALTPSLRLAELIEAGFSGRLEPMTCAPVAAAPRPGEARKGALLVVNAGGLMATLAAAGCRRPLVAVEDVLQSAERRPDIVAALISAGPAVVSPELLERLPKLEVVGLVGLSFARHRPDLWLDRGIALVNASAAYADSVAEFALGLAVLARRRAFVSDRVMRQGGWGTALRPAGWRGGALRTARAMRPALAGLGLEPALLAAWRRTRPIHRLDGPSDRSTRDLRDAAVGLIGWGANARAFARLLAAAGARVSVFSQHAAPDELRGAGVARASLAEVLAADIVSLHRGLTPETRHALGSAELARLRPGAVLINVARAALIEPRALLARLREGDIFACLDVFEDEPPSANDPLRRLPNVFLTSHIAGGSPDTQALALREVLGKIERRLAGGRVPSVSRDRLATMT